MGQIEQDTYTRANAGSWGNSSDGNTWSGDTSFASISSNTGLLSTGSPSAFPQLRLGTKAARDAEVIARVSLGHLSNTLSINARVQSGGNYYCAALSSSALQIQVVAGFGATTLATTSVSPVAASFYWIRLRTVNTTISVKFWLDGTAEPAAWTLSFAGDTTYPSFGGWGILAGLNTTTPVSINSFTVATAGEQGGSSIIVPNYIYPTPGAWSEYVSGFPTCATIVANPASGPGASPNSDYTTAINAARAAGLQVIGYVHTSYTAVDIAVVKADIDSWYSFYTVDGIFIDEVQATTGASFTYYQGLYNYIKAKHATRNFVVMNPGVTPDESYMQISDSIIILENSYTGWQSATPYAAWMANYLASKMCIVIHTISDTNGMQAIINAGKAHNVGSYFLTDQAGYNAVPSELFWQAELNAVRGQTTARSHKSMGGIQP